MSLDRRYGAGIKGWLFALLMSVPLAMSHRVGPAAEPLRVGSAAIEIPADDTMDMAGGIHPWKAKGAEAPLRLWCKAELLEGLRATADVIESDPD